MFNSISTQTRASKLWWQGISWTCGLFTLEPAKLSAVR